MCNSVMLFDDEQKDPADEIADSSVGADDEDEFDEDDEDEEEEAGTDPDDDDEE